MPASAGIDGPGAVTTRPAALRDIRAVLTAPLPEGLPGPLIVDLAEASAALSTLKPISPRTVDAAPEHFFHPLRHELSGHYLALHPLSRPAGRSRLEARVLRDFEASNGDFDTMCQERFLTGLHSLNRSLTEGKGGRREGFVKLADDRAGNQIYFPDVSSVPGQLERVRLLMAGEADAPPLFAAAAAYLLLLNCHPFTDGNGRTARVLINRLLHRAGMPRDVYIPLHELARRSHGGYEIALRMAEVRGQWAPFLRWLLEAISCCRAIARPAAG